MEQTIHSKSLPSSRWYALGSLILYGVSTILSSPKWGLAFFAWLAPFFLLYFFRLTIIKRKLLWAFIAIFISSTISNYEVIPFPLPVLAVFMLLACLKSLLILQLDQWMNRRSTHFLTTLFYPAASVFIEFISAQTGGNAWWSIANSQYPFTWITQLASVTGLWGISFLIYWVASSAAWCIQAYTLGKNYKRGMIATATAFFIVVLFGAIRYNISPIEKNKQVRIAGLSVPSLGFLESLYKDFCGKDIKLNPHLSVTSGVLQEVNRAQLPFIESADSIKFSRAFAAMKKINDSLFTLSQQAADSGAKIISWSEANAFIFRKDDSALTERGKLFAKRNKVYLLMAMAVIEPGKITFGKKFLENKTLFIGPDGTILNVFHKNNPVPLVESSAPGDGVIPVIETPYGSVSTSICYDADFPQQMQQLGKKKTDVLFLPSGDWFAISPYHTYMAVYRGIENGCSIVRQVSNGLSIATDYRGRAYASMNYFNVGTKLWVADVPFGHVSTIYSKIGDVFGWLCLLVTLFGIGWLIVQKIIAGRAKKRIAMVAAA